MADSFLRMVEAWLSPGQGPAGRRYDNAPPPHAPAIALGSADRKLRIECEILMIAPRFADCAFRSIVISRFGIVITDFGRS